MIFNLTCGSTQIFTGPIRVWGPKIKFFMHYYMGFIAWLHEFVKIISCRSHGWIPLSIHYHSNISYVLKLKILPKKEGFCAKSILFYTTFSHNPCMIAWLHEIDIKWVTWMITLLKINNFRPLICLKTPFVTQVMGFLAGWVKSA